MYNPNKVYNQTSKPAITKTEKVNPEYAGWKIDCCFCNCKRQVVSSRTVAARYDATEVYTLECGHTVI